MNRNLQVLTLKQVIEMFTRRMVLSYASLYIIALGGDSNQIGLINSLRPLAGLIIFPLAGYLTDRSGRVRLIALAGYASAFTMLLYVFAPSWHWVALGAFIQGLMVFQFPPMSALLADSLEPRFRGQGIAAMSSVANMLAILSPYVGALVLVRYGDNMGMRILYAVYVVSLLAGATLVIRYLKETHTVEGPTEKLNVVKVLWETYADTPALIRDMDRSVKALAVLVGMGFVGNGFSSPFWVVYVTEEIGLSTVEWGLILLAELVFKAVLTLPGGVFADRFGRTRTLFVAVLLSLVSIPAMMLARTFLHVLLIRLALGLVVALFLPASSALLADYTPREVRGRVMAAIGRGAVMVGAAGGGTGGPGMGYLFTVPVIISSMLGGVLYSLNPDYVWLCVLATCVIQFVCVVFFIRDPTESHR